MKDLIVISTAVIGNEKLNTVNARNLHLALGVKKDFSSWVKAQIKSLGLDENIDYVAISLKRGVANSWQSGRPSVEYHLTLDTAKHIAMASRTKRGKEVRRYFIEVEKEFYSKQKQCGCTNNLNARVLGYKGALTKKNKQIAKLKEQLAQSNTPGQQLAQDTMLDIAAEYAKLKAELNSRADSLEFIATSFREKTETIDRMLGLMGHFLPNTQKVTTQAQNRHQNELIWQKDKIENKI